MGCLFCVGAYYPDFTVFSACTLYCTYTPYKAFQTMEHSIIIVCKSLKSYCRMVCIILVINHIAETENVQQRMLKLVEEAKLFGIQSFSKDILEVAGI